MIPSNLLNVKVIVSPSSAKMDQKRIVVIASVAIVAVIGVAVLLKLTLWAKPSCNHVNDLPKIDVTKVSTLASSDNIAMAKTAAYAKFGDKTLTYLELNLKSVEEAKPSENKRVLTFNFDCGKLTFDVVYTADKGKAAMQDVDNVIFTQVGGDGDGKQCRLNTFKFNDSKDVRYSCQKEIIYPCTPVDQKDAKDEPILISLNAIDFEVDGNADTIKKGKFSKDATKKDCTK